MIYKNLIDHEFGKQIADWICWTSLEHTRLMLHEGTHLLSARMAGWEPEVYGPAEDSQGSVGAPPFELYLTAGVLIAKFYIGPSMIEDVIFGEGIWKQIHHVSSFDFESYHRWKYRIGNPLDRDSEEVFSVRAVRKSVYADFARPAFRSLLICAAREYEQRVSAQVNLWQSETIRAQRS